ncbi:MAG: hypothetical protein ABIF40_00165 [archaeon]
MIISFFEEFPTKKNLDKIKFVKFPTKLYVAAKSLKEFCEIKKQIKSKYIKEVIYWPILKNGEGYWLSPWTKRKALKRTINDVRNMNVLWDAELPRKKRRLLTEMHNFFRNKKDIQNFFKSHKKDVYVAEYLIVDGIMKNFMGFFGLNFDPKKYNNKIVKMVYSSMHDFGEQIIKYEFEKGVKDYGDSFLVALGTTAVGKLGTEPKIKPSLLKRDLKLAKNNGVKEVIIFRLGGLNKKYLDVFSEFL